MAIGAALPEGQRWAIVDGNLPNADPLAELVERVERARGTSHPVDVVAFTVMPGPQLVSAAARARAQGALPGSADRLGGQLRQSLSGARARRAYVDWVVRGQGEHAFVELLDVLRGARTHTASPVWPSASGTAATTSVQSASGSGPTSCPAPPYHRMDVAEYLHPTVLGNRSGVYRSIGCPHGCKFCGVISVFGRKERFGSAARTVEHLAYLVREHGMDSVHFYDNNFFVSEPQACEMAERMAPLAFAGGARRAWTR